MRLNAIRWDIDPILFEIGSFGLRYYSLCFLAAFVVAYVIMLKIFRREGRPPELLDQLSIYIFFGTLIGARLGHCLFYDFQDFVDHPLQMLLPVSKVNGSWKLTGYQGLASHGGAVGILTALWLFCRKTKTDFMWISDRLVIAVPLAGMFVRFGNFFNSEIVGLPAPEGLPWAVVFVREDLVPRHPAQLYEALCYAAIFIVLWLMYHRNSKPKPGLLFGLFLVLLFGVRFVLEFYKENQEVFEDGMLFNMGQWLSVPFVLFGLWLMFRKRTGKP